MIKIRKTYLLLGGLALCSLLGAGCKSASTGVATAYGSDYMVLEGPDTVVQQVCRTVLEGLSVKEIIDENTTKYPHFSAGSASSTSEGERVALKVYLETKGEDGAHYKFTILWLGEEEHVVLLQSDAEDPDKLVNALYAELAEQEIQVEQVPVAVEGTWTSEDEQIFSLSVKTEKVMDKEIPIREGKLYLVDENSAFLLAEGFGLELTPRKAKRPDKRHDKHEPATSTSLLRRRCNI